MMKYLDKIRCIVFPEARYVQNVAQSLIGKQAEQRHCTPGTPQR